MAIETSVLADLPPNVRAACDELKSHITEAWDAHEAMERSAVFASPLGKLVTTFGDCERGNETYRRLAWLSFFVARRSLDCWEHHRAEPKPFEAVAFLRDWIAAGMTPPEITSPSWFERVRSAVGTASDPWIEFARPAKPRFREISDCCYSEWASAAGAVANAVQFSASGDALHAIYVLGDADVAHGECSIHGEKYRDWLMDVAIPVAWSQREMSSEELNAFKTYDQEKIRRWRESGRGI